MHVQSVVHDWILSYFLFSHFHCIYFFGDLLLVTLTPEITATLLIGYCSLVTKLRPTLLPLPMDYIQPGSSVHGISQTRILEWVPISFSRGDLPLKYIKHVLTNICWRCGKVATLTHYCQECKTVQSLCKIIQRIIKKLELIK